MECTQRLECTQDVYETSSERTCPEQIGFLGICGSKHPIKKGPNKVGRDPQSCGIVLNDNSISRQHAVINILNKKDFMLMDLDSSNKTKLLNKTLDPYIPHPLRDGDTVQFGQLFGIFRLLEDNDDLPMTQAVEIPETPINIRLVSRLKTAQVTTVPESPDVSDRDDSIIVHSQPQNTANFKSPNNKLIKSSAKVVGNQQVNKIDNVYWNSSKKSDSFSSNFESNSFNKSNSVSPKKLSIERSIYDMETQAPASAKVNETSDSIYEANTQVPNISKSPNIYSCNTQVPNIDKLPEVFKVQDQNNVQLNLFTTNEGFNIFDAKTQVTSPRKENYVTCANNIGTQKDDEISCISKKLNSSDEEICFDEIDSQQVEDECGSQPLLPPGQDDIENLLIPLANPELQKSNATAVVINDSDSKDCDEIVASQAVTIDKHTDDGDDTDCEDIMIELKVSNANEAIKIQIDNELTNCEDNCDQVNAASKQKVADDSDVTDCEDDIIEISQNRTKTSDLNENFEDLPTQVIGEELPNHLSQKRQTIKDDILFEDMLTQVIEECPIESGVNSKQPKGTEKAVPLEDIQTQVIPQEQLISTPKIFENSSSFKRPLPSPRLIKKDIKSTAGLKRTSVKDTNSENKLEDNDNYYEATQQIYNDLCTQIEKPNKSISSKIENNMLVREKSFEDSDANNVENNSFVSNMTKEQVRDVIGVDPYVTLSKKKSSDSSDLEITPKKFNPSKFLMIDLPNSQEIKSCDFISLKGDVTDSSDGFEETEKQNIDTSPVGFYRKRRKKDIKQDLMKKFDINNLPTRAITRIRKPTSKLLDSDDSSKKRSAKILQSNLGLDKEHEVDAEVMQLNLKRLRSKMEKVSSKKSSTNSAKDEKNPVSKPVEKEQSSLKSDKREKKKTTVDKKNNGKELKQQTINSMFTESSFKDVPKIEKRKEAQTDTTDSSVKTRKSGRNKTKDNKAEHSNKVKEKNIEISETKKSSSQTHSNRKEKKDTIINLTSEDETVVRRSRRQQASKHKNKEEKTEKSQSTHEKRESIKDEQLKNKTSKSLQNSATSNSEHSRVYNLSSETAVDSPASLKRHATSDILPSKAKRTKSSNASNVSLRAPSARGNRTQYVLFTAFPCEEVKQKLERLGAVIVSDVKSCSVVLTLQIRRTFKLLCAMGLGKPIVGPNWVQACADSNMIVDPWLYLIKDEATEKRFGFNLRQSLTCKRNFLKGHSVFCTPNVSPSAQEMKMIVECSGGTWRARTAAPWYCVTCGADRAQWDALRRRGATLVSTEFVLAGVLQQRLDPDRDRLE